MLGNRTSLKADAVLFATGKIGVVAIECIASLGLKIPDDVALVSFDNAAGDLHGSAALKQAPWQIRLIYESVVTYPDREITRYEYGTC